MPKLRNPPPHWFCGSTKKPTTGFEAKPGETVATGFEVKLEKTVATGFKAKPAKTIATGFEAKPLETVVTGFEAKSAKTIQVVLRPNHSQTVNLGFKAQPRNLCSSSLRAWCRPHTTPLSTRPVRSSPTLCTRSPTPATVLVATRHAAHATCTPRDKQTWFSKQNKDKRKTKWNYPGFKFKHHQVNDSSQSNQVMNHLVSQSPPWWVHWQQKHKVWSSNPRPKKPKKAQNGHLEEGNPQKPTKGMKSGKAKQNGKKEQGKAQKSKKGSKSAQKLKINTPPEINST
jgi:hypothetical protein